MRAVWSVRRGEPGDVGDVFRLERAISEAPHWTEEEYVSIAARKGAGAAVQRCLYVARCGDELLGFAVGSVSGGAGEPDGGALTRAWGELESVAVAAEARRSGIGRGLCEAVVGWCRKKGADCVELEVREGSEGAIGLYRQIGFVAVGRRPGYYASPAEDAVLMRIALG